MKSEILISNDDTKTKRISRWGPRNEKADFGVMSPQLPPGLTESQVKSYVVYIRLEEINRKLASGRVLPFRTRSRSPGARETDSEAYYRRKLEDERARLIEAALKDNPEYSTDLDYNTWLDRHLFGPGQRDRRTRQQQPSQSKGGNKNEFHNTNNLSTSTATGTSNNSNSNNNNTGGQNRFHEKVWIPQREYPDVNFIGLLIGPRGHTLKKMESETGARISIRGKGSLKEGKNDPASLAAAHEELHALVMADSMDKVDKCVRIINKIIETAASTPEESNELKRLQLRELAALNGTLRDADSIICSNCGMSGHRRFECTERRNVTNSIICRICGGAGHLASDCIHRDNPEMLQMSRMRAEQMDSAYQDFLADIGQKPKAISGMEPNYGSGDDVGGAAPWAATIMGGQQPLTTTTTYPDDNDNKSNNYPGTTPWSQ